MLFASSKDALRRALVGIVAEIQATEFSEIAEEVGACAALSLLPLCRLPAPPLCPGRALTRRGTPHSAREGLERQLSTRTRPARAAIRPRTRTHSSSLLPRYARLVDDASGR